MVVDNSKLNDIKKKYQQTVQCKLDNKSGVVPEDVEKEIASMNMIEEEDDMD